MSQNNPYFAPGGLAQVRDASLGARAIARGNAALDALPSPEYREEGQSGGVVDFSKVSGWQNLVSTYLRDPQFRTLTVAAQSPGVFFEASHGYALQLVCQVTYGLGGTVSHLVTFDVPPNGIVHLPISCNSLSASVAMAPTGLSAAAFAASLLVPGGINRPPTYKVDPTKLDQSGVATGPCIVSAALQPAQALPPNPLNMATRKISVLLAAGDSVSIPVPYGAQTVDVTGPADVAMTVSQKYGPGQDLNTNVNPITPAVAGRIAPLQLSPMTTQINITSAGGGMVNATFYLGIG